MGIQAIKQGALTIGPRTGFRVPGVHFPGFPFRDGNGSPHQAVQTFTVPILCRVLGAAAHRPVSM